MILPPDEYKALTTQVFQRDGWKCRICKKRSGLHAHHIVFRSEIGDDASWNLVTVCGGDNSCHKAIHGEVKGYFIIILPASGDPDDEIDADVGLKFLKCGAVRKRVRLKAKK